MSSILTTEENKKVIIQSSHDVIFYHHLVEKLSDISAALDKGLIFCGENLKPNKKLFEFSDHDEYFQYNDFDQPKLRYNNKIISCRGPIISTLKADTKIEISINFERFSHPAGFMDAFKEKWWPAHLHFDGIPMFDEENIIAPNLHFTTIPSTQCKLATTPVFIKSAASNVKLRDIMREIFNYQRDDSMKIFFIFGQGEETQLQ